jgi:hypothetical protein
MAIFHAKQKAKKLESLALIQENPVRRAVLLSCQETGMTCQALAEKAAGAEYRAVYSALSWLASPGHGLLPLLSAIPMRLESRPGRPPTGYVLTDVGAEIVSLLDPGLPVQAPNVRDQSDMQHRWCQLELLTRARQAELDVHIEQVLAYGTNRTVRCDVVLETPERAHYIEIEQELGRTNLSRAVAKFGHWQEFSKTHTDKKIDLVLLFNLSQAGLAKTLSLWQDALGLCKQEYGQLRFSPRYLLMGEIFSGDWLSVIRSAPALKPRMPEKPPEMEPQKPSQPLQPLSDPLSQLEPAPGGLHPLDTFEFMQRVGDYDQIEDPAERFQAFLGLMNSIYGASYYRDSPTLLYSIQPRESLWMLRYYIFHPANQAMYAELQESFSWLAKQRGGMGLIMFRDAVTRILWDVFLRHHGFSRGGSLGVSFQIPDFGDRRSDYYVAVQFHGFSLNSPIAWMLDKAEDALGWVLASLFIYCEELGLGKRPWRASTAQLSKKGKK